MMTLTKMSPSGWRYYAEEVSSGREDYYAVSSETLGRFVGRGAVAFGLEDSDVSPLALERLFGTQAKLSTTQEQGALSAALTAEDKAAHVDVSPRFGHFVDGQVVADPSAALASPAPRSASTGG